MKIMCRQEHYDKVINYAKSINDTTLDACFERLRSWESNTNRPCEIEIHYDFAPYSFMFKERYADGSYGIVGGILYHGKPDQSHAFLMDSPPRLEYSYLNLFFRFESKIIVISDDYSPIMRSDCLLLHI